MNNQSNTAQGENVEHLLQNSLPVFNEGVFAAVCASCGLDHRLHNGNDLVGARGKRKTDVEFFFEGGAALKVSCKSYTGGGYNHLERRKLSSFCERNRIGRADAGFLQNMILRKARGESKLLVLPSEHSRVEKMFGRINAARAALVGLDHPDILAIYSVNENKFRLYHMLRDVFPALNEHEIGFSSRGGNILLGPYVAVQRKGSASGERGDDINDIEHGANHLQTKIKTKKLFEEVAPTAEYRLAF